MFVFIEWYSFDIILTSSVISADSSISTINNVGIIPSLFAISGRGTCVIDEANSLLKNYAMLNFTNTLFYFQCAGPTLITINLPAIETYVQDKKDVSFQRKKRGSYGKPGSIQKIGVRLFSHYDMKKVSFETECFQWCLSEIECVASSLSLSLSWNNYCYLFTNEYEAKEESDWISEFKIVPGSIQKIGVRLFSHYDMKEVSFESECFQWCLSEIECVASSLSLSFSWNNYCYLFTNEYEAKEESDWISEFKIDPGSLQKIGVRLYSHYDMKKVSFETECFQWCLSEIKCVASSLSLSWNKYSCYLFTNEYMAKVESDWISEFKIDPGIILFIYYRHFNFFIYSDF